MGPRDLLPTCIQDLESLWEARQCRWSGEDFPAHLLVSSGSSCWYGEQWDRLL